MQQQPGPVQPLVPQHTAFCIGCKVQLSYPAGSPVIQCPRCNQTQNPGNSHQTPCLNCGTILAHPSNSVFIQCPNCNLQMVTSSKERLFQNTQGLPYLSHHYVPSASARKQKKRKDPSAPKASSNAYMIFCKERRSKLKEEHPELPFGKLGAKLGEIWRNMSAEQKKPYEDRAAADRERYRKQMQDYQCSTPV